MVDSESDIAAFANWSEDADAAPIAEAAPAQQAAPVQVGHADRLFSALRADNRGHPRGAHHLAAAREVAIRPSHNLYFRAVCVRLRALA